MRVRFWLVLITLGCALRFSSSGGIEAERFSIFREEPIHGFGLVDAFPGIEFTQPVVITSPPGYTNSLFVVERGGMIYALTNLTAPNKTPFLDLTASTITLGGLEPGLLGMAFHPRFASNGYFFIYRSVVSAGGGAAAGYYNRLSRFRVQPGAPWQASRDTEEIVLQQRDNAFHIHNAGDIHFGPDGYLYLALGEGAPPPEDFRLTRQPIDKNFFGVILRIDVDKRPGNIVPNPHPGISDLYRVPRDNPFVQTTNYHGIALEPGRVRTEIFALGLRNPWRFTFDPESGEIICGDVGERSYEEVNVIRYGRNYGWPYLEGVEPTPHFGARPPGFSNEPPLWSYYHDSTPFSGQAVIGGRVYQGNSLPEMRRAYVFGDNVRGHIWGLFREDVHGTNEVRWLTGEPGISTFGLDPRDKELLVASLITGRIRKLVYRDPGASKFPQRLSETGLFSELANLTPTAGVVPYAVNVPFWSDHAEKRRWYVLPERAFFGFNGSNHWTLPSGTMWVKHFDLPLAHGAPNSLRKLSTRLLVKTDASVYGVTYRWNPAGTDATLVDSAGADGSFVITNETGLVRTQSWRFPSRLECKLCHNPLAGGTLAFSTAQLNCPEPATGVNQLEQFALRGRLYGMEKPAAELPSLAPRKNPRFSTEYHVRSYLAANCAQCHFPENPIIARWDARFETPMEEKGLLNLHVIPNLPESSMLFTRVAIPDFLHMPPISTRELDQDSIELLRRWIKGFPRPPWQSTKLGEPVAPGNALVEGAVIEVAGYAGTNGLEAGQFLWRPSTGAVQIVAQITDRNLASGSGRAGIRLRAFRERPQDYFVGLTSSEFFSVLNGRKAITRPVNNAPLTIRIVAETGWLRSYVDAGAGWEPFDGVRNPLGEKLLAGFSVVGSTGLREQFARFGNVSMLSAHVRLIDGSTNLTTYNSARFNCVVDGMNYEIGRVDFLTNGAVFTQASVAPFEVEWQPQLPGRYSISARIITTDGLELNTYPLEMNVAAPGTRASLEAEDTSSQGTWRGRFGEAGYISPEFASWPATVRLDFANARTERLEQVPVTSAAALPQYPGAAGRSLSYWTGGGLRVSLNFPQPILHKLTLYFADPAGTFGKQELIIRDKFTGAVLFSREIRNYSSGLHLCFLVLGNIEIALEGVNPALMAMFLDKSPFPAPAMNIGAIPTEAMAGSILALKPGFAPGSSVERLELLLNGKAALEINSPSGTVIFTNPPVGVYNLGLRAHDGHGQITQTTNLPLRVLMPPPAVKFLGGDDETKGEWPGRYGREGFVIPGAATNLPAQLQLTPTNHFLYQTLPGFAAHAAPIVPESGDRSAANWTATFEFSIDVGLPDGRARELSIYLFDEPLVFRSQTIQFIDPDDGTVISELDLEDFEHGRYYQWSIQGKVRVRMVARSSGAMVSAIFFDPAREGVSPLVIANPASETAFAVPGRFAVDLLPGPEDDRVRGTELYLDNELLVEALGPRTRVTAPLSFKGSHWLSAAALDENNTRTWSSPIQIKGHTPANSLQFLREDAATSGDWPDNYGTEGLVIAGDSTNFPRAASFELSLSEPWIWEKASVRTKAPVRGSGAGRAAAAWYDESNARKLELTVAFPDGEPRELALYFMDFHADDRQFTIRAYDVATGEKIEDRRLADFAEGKYLIWRITGTVRFEIIGLNAPPVMSGIFVDPGLGYDDWRRGDFAWLPDASAQAPEADPDADGKPNLVEFLAGTDPATRDELWHAGFDSATGEVVAEVAVGRNRTGVIPRIEISSDLVNWGPISGYREFVRQNLSQRIFEYRLPSIEGAPPVFFRFGVEESIPK